MKVTQVTCDYCGRDLSTTGNSGDTRVLLEAERIPNPSGMSTLSIPFVWPTVSKHFCGKRCLKPWITEARQ